MVAKNFIYDGISLDELGLMICSFEGSQDGEVTAGNSIEFTYSKASNSVKWKKVSATYNEQLSFTLQIGKDPCVFDEPPFSEEEIAWIQRWLNRKDDKWLQLIQEGYEDIFFNCHIAIENYEKGGECFGFTLTVTCDAPFGWSELQTLDISSDGSYTTKYYDPSDDIGEICPTIQITSKANQDITLTNNLTNKTTVIKNCLADEHIVLSSEMWATSSECVPVTEGTGYNGSHSTFFDDFNYEWFTIGNTFSDRVNEITITGNCDVHISWRYPRRAVLV